MRSQNFRSLILTTITLAGLPASALFGQTDPYPDLELSDIANAIIPTEINYNPPEAGSDTTSFIEFYNRTNQPIDMTGFRLLAGVEYTFSETIQPKGFLILANSSQAVQNRFDYNGPIAQWTSGGLSPSGEWIILTDAEGKGIFKLRYDDEAPWPVGNEEGEVSPDGDGTTLVLVNTFSDVADANNWTVSKKQVPDLTINSKDVYGSPGELESDGLGLLSAVKDSDTQITVTFSAEVQTNGTNPGDFAVQDGQGTSFVVSAQADGTPGDAEIVLTVADFSSAVGDVTVTYTKNNNEISDLSGTVFAENSSASIDLDTTAPTIIRASRNSDTQITLLFDEPVQINADDPLYFELAEGDAAVNITGWANGTNDNEIVLTVAYLSEAAPMLDLSYNNEVQDIVDYGRNSSSGFSVTVCPDGFSCEQVSATICREETFLLNSGRTVVNPQTVPYDTVGTEITRYDLVVDADINCCPDGFTCNIIDVTECDNTVYTSPLGNTTDVDGPVIDVHEADNIRNTYSVTFDRAAATPDVFMDAIIAESGSVTYQANTNTTGVLNFDNSQDYWVDLNALQDDLNGTSRSIFMWIKSGNVASSEQILFGINPASNGNTITNLFIDNNDNNLETNDGGNNRNASFDVSGEVWNYVGYTYDGSTNETVIYVNGIAQITYTNEQATTATSRYSLGQEFDSGESNHYNGDMAEISVWNEVLTGAEVRQAMQEKITNSHPKFTNLVGYYSVFGECDDDTSVLKDHSGKGNDGVMKNGFTQDFKNVESIPGFNSVGWYQSLFWKKDGTEVATANTFTTNVAAGSYEFTAARPMVKSTDTWTMTTGSNATTTDNLADETLCSDDAITRTLTDISAVNYLDFEKDNSNYIEVSSITDDLVGTDRSVFLWVNKESNVPSGSSYQILSIQGNDGLDDIARFYISAGEDLGITSNGSDYTSNQVALDTWTHVGYTYDATTMETRLYINGAVVRTISGVDMGVVEGSVATMGMRYDEEGPSRFFDGKMAEVTVWSKLLTEAEVTALMGAAPAHDAAHLVAAYGTLQTVADNQLRDLTAHGNNGLASHSSIFVTTEEAQLTDYDAGNNYSFSWKKEGAEFDTEASAAITIDEGTSNYSVTYGTPFFQKTDEFALSYTNLLPAQPTDQTARVSGGVTFEVDQVSGASYQWFKRASGFEFVTKGENGLDLASFTYAVYEKNGVIYAGGSGGLFMSKDGGDSWTDLNIQSLDIYNSLVVSIGGIGDKVLVNTTFNTILVENDGEDISQLASFTEMTNGMGSSLVFSHIDGTNVYTANAVGLSISNDSGETWNFIPGPAFETMRPFMMSMQRAIPFI
jgi:hypothetical protein